MAGHRECVVCGTTFVYGCRGYKRQTCSPKCESVYRKRRAKGVNDRRVTSYLNSDRSKKIVSILEDFLKESNYPTFFSTPTVYDYIRERKMMEDVCERELKKNITLVLTPKKKSEKRFNYNLYSDGRRGCPVFKKCEDAGEMVCVPLQQSSVES